MFKRALAVLIVAALAGGAAAYTLRPDRGVPEDAPSEARMARDVGSQVMLHLRRGHVEGRSGEIMLVPKPHHFLIGEWDLTTLGSSTPTTSTSHPNPWDYLAHVPIVLWGQPWVPQDRVIDERIDISRIAPTIAAVLGIKDMDVSGSLLPGVHVVGRSPKVILTVVIDGGGWNALQEHPDSWPHLQELMRGGTTFVNATIGSAPSITGALHATFGTGVYPVDHGIPGNQMRGPDGENVDTWKDEADPSFLKVPTISELWDEATGNRAVVGTVSYEGWHLGMIGHGAQRPGGDKDFAALWRPEANEWWINEDYYTLPPSLRTTDVDRLESYESELDARDGLADGTWFGHTLEEIQEDLTRPGSPAFVRFTGDASLDAMKDHEVGRDEITDLVWVELKAPDYAGHAWNMMNPEQADVLRETDAQIERMRRHVERVAGERDYMVIISADHGQQPLPDVVGGWRINSKELQRDIERRFGPVVEKVTPVDVYLDLDELEAAGVQMSDIARYVGTYTLGENIPDEAVGADLVPQARLDDVLFAGAFSTGYLTGLTPDTIESFGPGRYPEGDLGLKDGG